MKEGPVIASVAALLGDPARANILTALIDGRALTVSELARAAGVTIQTASGHLAKLADAQSAGRREAGPAPLFPPVGARCGAGAGGADGPCPAHRRGAGPRPARATRPCAPPRICYDHLAGERGVAMLAASSRRSLIAGDEDLALTPVGPAISSPISASTCRALEQGRRPRLPRLSRLERAAQPPRRRARRRHSGAGDGPQLGPPGRPDPAFHPDGP